MCELDLIYHFDRVNYILDELVMAGMVLETNVDSIIQAINDGKKVEQDENRSSILGGFGWPVMAK